MWLPAGFQTINLRVSVHVETMEWSSVKMAEKVWQALANELADTTAEAGRSVVAVIGGKRPSSGVVLSGDAVVTVNHGLRRDEEIAVVSGPGERVTGKVAGRDASTDLAVIKLQSPITAPAAKWGSTEKVRVGEFVLALGRSWRGNVVASSGILSGVIAEPFRTWRGGEIDRFIRPDLMLYPGFSGGPLVGASGEFLGINTAGLHRSGITVPAESVARVTLELLEKGRIERPYLGVGMQAVPVQESLKARLNLKVSEGLLVVHLEPQGPAEKAGLLVGDMLIELHGQPVSDTEEVQAVLRGLKAGAEVEAGLIRAGALQKVKIALEARPAR
jgi:S1-C subfamily serine protease